MSESPSSKRFTAALGLLALAVLLVAVVVTMNNNNDTKGVDSPGVAGNGTEPAANNAAPRVKLEPVPAVNSEDVELNPNIHAIDFLTPFGLYWNSSLSEILEKMLCEEEPANNTSKEKQWACSPAIAGAELTGSALFQAAESGQFVFKGASGGLIFDNEEEAHQLFNRLRADAYKRMGREDYKKHGAEDTMLGMTLEWRRDDHIYRVQESPISHEGHWVASFTAQRTDLDTSPENIMDDPNNPADQPNVQVDYPEPSPNP